MFCGHWHNRVFGVILSGYLMEYGNLLVLLPSAELVIIGAAVIGTVLLVAMAADSQ